jgi:hypothetical protein
MMRKKKKKMRNTMRRKSKRKLTIPVTRIITFPIRMAALKNKQ